MQASPKSRLSEAKQWLLDNPEETPYVAAKIFKVNRTTLAKAKKRGSLAGKPRGGQNRILSAVQGQAVHAYIKALLDNSQLPTKEIIFSAICYVRKHTDHASSPSPSWFRKWWKSQPYLHKIKTKPIARTRITAQDHIDVENWFKRYKATIRHYNIHGKDIYNFDETGFRIGCPKGVDVLVPIELLELYSLSPENRKSITMIETIRADGRTPIPPVIVVQGKYHMASWYGKDKLHGSELVELSDSGYTTDKISLRYLQHFITHTNAGPTQPYKLLLMDNHGSHLIPEFTLLAREHHIVPFTLPAHLTHCMQPLDVGVFQPYKHWHNKAVQCAVESLDFDYKLTSFFRDLPQIRSQTFTVSTIKSAFRKSGMYPIQKKATFELMAKYAKEPETKPPEPELPKMGTPKTIRQVQYQMDELKGKVMDVLSSPSQRKFESFIKGTHAVLEEGEYTKFQLTTTHERLREIMIKKPNNRKRIQKGGELTAMWATSAVEERERKEEQKEAKKEARMLKKIANQEKREQKAAWVAWRKKERLRKKTLKEWNGILGAPVLYKEHTPPPFPEPGKEVQGPEPANTGLQTEYGPPEEVKIWPRGTETMNGAIPVQARTSFGVAEKEEEGREEEYISLNIGGDIGYESDGSESSDSSDSVNSMLGSSESDFSEEGEYFIL